MSKHKRTQTQLQSDIENLDFQGLRMSAISRRLNIPLSTVVDTLRPSVVAKTNTSRAGTLRI